MTETTFAYLGVGVPDAYEIKQRLHDNWGWFLALGIGLCVLGLTAMTAAGVATLASVLLFGTILAISGGIQVIHAFSFRVGHGFVFNLLAGILYIVVGVLMIAQPGLGAVSLTLLVASFLLVAGLFRTVWSIVARFPKWGWSLFSGLVTTALGFYLGASLPYSALWLIGTFVGVEMLFNGMSWVMLATAARTFDERRPERTAAGSAGFPRRAV